MNIFLKKVDISWNGLGLEGAKALKEMLINNNVLEEINISNNRIDTEASVEIGRGYLLKIYNILIFLKNIFIFF